MYTHIYTILLLVLLYYYDCVMLDCKLINYNSKQTNYCSTEQLISVSVLQIQGLF